MCNLYIYEWQISPDGTVMDTSSTEVSMDNLPLEMLIQIAETDIHSLLRMIDSHKRVFQWYMAHPLIYATKIKSFMTTETMDAKTFRNTRLLVVFHLLGGLLHNVDDLPAKQVYVIRPGTSDKVLVSESWYKYGNLHRDDEKPAYMYYTFVLDVTQYEPVTLKAWFTHGVRVDMNDDDDIFHDEMEVDWFIEYGDDIDVDDWGNPSHMALAPIESDDES